MGKRRPAMDESQLQLGFEPAPLPAAADLAEFDRYLASAVGVMLKGDPRTRADVAGAVSELLGETVSKQMLDAYASEARGAHNISAARFLTLVAATQRYDVLDAVCRRIGCKILVGEQVHLAELGDIIAQLRSLEDRKRRLQAIVEPLPRGRRA